MIDDTPVKAKLVVAHSNQPRVAIDRPVLNIVRCNEEELSAHQVSLDSIENCLWD